MKRVKKHTLPAIGLQLYCHCGRPAILRSAEGLCKTHREGAMAYVCSGFPSCNSYVMAHPGTLEPMGSLAGPELRKLRAQAHRQLELLQSTGLMTKRQSYQWLAYVVQAPMSHAHIGHLGEYYCKEVIRESRKLLETRRALYTGIRTCGGGGENVGTLKPAAVAS